MPTNEKLAGIINSRDYEEDDADRLEAQRDEERKAVLRVRKNAFYGQGSWAKMHCFDVLNDKNHTAVYSVFDPLKHNCVRFVEVVLALGIFDHPLFS